MLILGLFSLLFILTNLKLTFQHMGRTEIKYEICEGHMCKKYLTTVKLWDTLPVFRKYRKHDEQMHLI